MRAALWGLAAVAVAAVALALAGVGAGSAPKGDPAPSTAAVAAAKRRIAAGDARVQAGRAAFEAQGCDDCHAVAAVGANGKLGPRLDALDDPRAAIAEAIAEPRKEIVKGYEGNLMPTDYVQRMGRQKIADVAAFLKAVSGTEGKKGD